MFRFLVRISILLSSINSRFFVNFVRNNFSISILLSSINRIAPVTEDTPSSKFQFYLVQLIVCQVEFGCEYSSLFQFYLVQLIDVYYGCVCVCAFISILLSSINRHGFFPCFSCLFQFQFYLVQLIERFLSRKEAVEYYFNST